MSPEPARILAVDDDALAREFLSETLRRKGYRVSCASGGQEALQLLRQQRYSLMVTDLKMPGIDGLGLLQETRRSHPETEVIVATAYASVESAVEAVRHGAFDYVTKPFTKERIEILVERALERVSLLQETRRLKEELHSQQATPIVGRHPKMQEALELARLVADTEATVLIRGESGTGKELIARFLHDESRRRDRPFIKVSCAALPESLLEAELFGHERGAFTTAYNRRIGRFEKAHMGTIFLDEIGDLLPSTQIRLLNVLQDRQFERLGSSEPIAVDVRVLAATNRPLEKLMQTGQFRDDLYYRLKVVEILLPPLRERMDDIPLLAEHFLHVAAKRFGRSVPRLSPEILDRLAAHDWPGNVRELENALERAAITAAGDFLRPEDLPSPVQASRTTRPPGALPVTSLADGERALIQRALERTRWNRSAAAHLLGIDRSTLARKIRTLSLRQT
jgi:DNA-binding NtrC family response regulator